MNEVTKIVDGEARKRKQETVTVGDGSIVNYLLSEHQFETLGENSNYERFLGIWTFCLGIAIPILLDIFPLEEVITTKVFMKFGVFMLCLGVGFSNYCEYRKKKSKYKTTYTRLKEEARIITKGEH
jgi:hypothetical protein